MTTASGRVPLDRTPDERAAEDAFQALYGAWEPMEPRRFAQEMDGFGRQRAWMRTALEVLVPGHPWLARL